ncbi:MAG: hypothetical protein HY763_15235 [Planctomycetes bacterium]|nr:hypothetical protein [Planctomycetota bacterium]
MPKTDTMEAIMKLNPTARPDFLSGFSGEDLTDYLHRLRTVGGPGETTFDEATYDGRLPTFDAFRART